MKKLLLLPLLFLVACGTTQNHTRQPNKPMPALSEGMSKEQIKSILGQPSKASSYKQTQQRVRDGKYYDVITTEYCYSEYFNKRLSDSYNEEKKDFDLKLTFDNNKLTGWKKTDTNCSM